MQSIDGIGSLIVRPNKFVSHGIDTKAWLAPSNIIEYVEAFDVMSDHVQKVLVNTETSEHVQKQVSPGVDELSSLIAEIRAKFEGHHP